MIYTSISRRLSFSDFVGRRKLIITRIDIEKRTRTINSAALLLSFLPSLRVKRFCFSSKVMLEVLLSSIVAAINVRKNIAEAYGPLCLLKSECNIINELAEPNNINKKNIRFQKLSRLSLSLSQLLFLVRFKVLESFNLLISSFVKSCIFPVSNYWFKIFPFIISRLARVLKQELREVKEKRLSNIICIVV